MTSREEANEERIGEGKGTTAEQRDTQRDLIK